MPRPSIWALADLHLALGVPEKTMEVFGSAWEQYMARIEKQWRVQIRNEDLVLLPGDISWAMHMEEAKPDFAWIDSLPGTKVLIRGNHDYWWSSLKKVRQALPTSIHVIQNDHFDWHDVTIGGARLWDTPLLSFEDMVEESETPRGVELVERAPDTAETEKIYQRELGRLEMSLQTLNPEAQLRIAMTHYPPVGPHLEPSPASEILEKYRIDICVFGHVHNAKKTLPLFGSRNGIEYQFVAADYWQFIPVRIA